MADGMPELSGRVRDAIFRAIDEVNAQLPPESAIAKSPEAVLFGKGGVLDSLGLVNLIVAAEGELAEVLEKPISLADERAMSQRNSPFRNVESLVAYVCAAAKESAHV